MAFIPMQGEMNYSFCMFFAFFGFYGYAKLLDKTINHQIENILGNIKHLNFILMITFTIMSALVEKNNAILIIIAILIAIINTVVPLTLVKRIKC